MMDRRPQRNRPEHRRQSRHPSSRHGQRQRGTAIAPFLLAGLMCFALACTSIKPLTGKARPINGPYPEQYREIIHHWIDDKFTELQGINSLEIVPPVPGVAEPFLSGDKTYGWTTMITLRAYDRIGMPTGPLRYNVLIREEQVVHYVRKVQ